MYATEARHAILPRQSVASSSGQAGVDTIVHPLTSIIPIPTSCFEGLYSVVTTYNPTPVCFIDYWRVHSECWPADFAVITGFTRTQLYSPGVCPSGYTPRSQITVYNPGPTTSAFCCPSGLTLANRPWGQDAYICQTTITTPTPLSCVHGSTTVTSNFQANQWAINVAWAETDLAQFTPSNAPLLMNGESIPSTAVTSHTSPISNSNTSHTSPVSTSHTSNATHDGSGGLSTGAKTGIGVGVAALFVAFLLGAAFYIYRRRKNKQIAEASHGSQSATSRSSAAGRLEHWRSEVGPGQSFTHHEMDNSMQKPKYYEMYSSTERSELDG